jgi:Zn-dependent protease with chaperone function
MIRFAGTYFDGKTSKAFVGEFLVEQGRLVVQGEEVERIQFPLDECVMTPPLGRTTRVIHFPGGARCETDDHEAVASLEEYLGKNKGLWLVNTLEQYWKTVAVCFMGLVVFIWLFMAQGIPLVAERFSKAIPPGVMENISQKTLDLLDKQYLAATELEQKRMNEIKTIFRGLSSASNSGFDYRLEFRKGDKGIGANAFALPAGIIIVTDELVKLAENDQQLIGVLVHEMGHVENRHALRSVFQNAGVFLIVSALVGDITSITSTAATLPTLLAETGYSRQFEKESDLFAGRYCIKQGWSTAPMIKMLQNLAKDEAEFPGQSILSTHPDTAARVKYLQSLQDGQ